MAQPLDNLTVTIVCKDNERTIPRTLASIEGLTPHVLAIDSGSTDATLDLLERAGARVVHQDWLGYVRQKQFALERCDTEWVLHLDSDESLEPPLRAAVVRALHADDPGVAGYEMNRKIFYAGRMLNHAWQPEWRLRLARRTRAHWTGRDPHDALAIMPGQDGRIDRLPGDMRHDAIPSIAEFLARQAAHARIGAESDAAAGRRGSIRRLVGSPIAAWAKQVVLRGAWRDGWRGMAAASATAAAALMKHAILLERTRAPAQHDAERGTRTETK